MLIKRILNTSTLVKKLIITQELQKFKIKRLDANSLIRNYYFNAKIADIQNKILDF